MDKHGHFGWVRVRGTIDGYPIKQYHLAPMGNGKLFFPIKLEIRKKLNKKAGDTVSICLFRDDSALEIPPELSESLELEAGAMNAFQKLSESEKKQIVDKINGAKTESTKVKHIVAVIRKLAT
ncbi:MAG: YdeI/OmpD-associated family protein, partial [Bacteroidota bacterium]